MPGQPLKWNSTDAQGRPLRWNQPGLTWNGTLPPNPQPKKTMQLRVQLGFTTAADHSLEERSGAVSDNLYSSTLWTPPPAFPVVKTALDSALLNFTNAIASQAQGGTSATAIKNNMRSALIDLLRQLAGFVQENHDNDLGKLLASGFEAVSTNRSPSPLAKPIIREITNGVSGQLLVRVTPIANARCYEARYALLGPGGSPGPWQPGGLFTNSRSIPINNLTPGGNYQAQVRAIGGSTGYSDWSDVVQHMSM